MNNVTLLVKTFKRPEHLERLLNSVEEHYPKLSVIVVDDSDVPYADEICGKYRNNDFMAYTMPYDIGLSAGRNAGLDTITTPYFVLCDDDHYFNSSLAIPLLLGALADGMDIAGGHYVEPNGRETRWDGLLVRRGEDVWGHRVPVERPYTRVEIVQNFFAARTDEIKLLRWDDQIKIGTEHCDFFYRAKLRKLKVAYVPDAYVCHRHPEDAEEDGYQEARNRGMEFKHFYLEKHGVKRWWRFGARNPMSVDTKEPS